jgi:hypothetical protein
MTMRKYVISVSILLSGLAAGFLARNVPLVVLAGPQPPLASQNGDVNGDGSFDIADVVYSLLFLFKDGPEPVACAQGVPNPDGDAEILSALDRIAQAIESPCHERLNRYADNGDGTLTDTCTGLIWQRSRAAIDVNFDGLPDKANFFQVSQFVDELEFAGRSGWRLPTVYELESLSR